MKVERGEEILVRVGGGFMSIQDFLDQYTDPEAEKIKYKDVIEKFRQKMQTQKNLSENAIERIETSPVKER